MESIARPCPDDGGGTEREPSAVELAAIEAEWPQIEADLAALDAEIAEIAGGPGAGELVWRRYRRAQRQVVRPCVRVWGWAA